MVNLTLFRLYRRYGRLAYDGWIIVETDGYAGDPKVSAERSKQYLEELLQELQEQK